MTGQASQKRPPPSLSSASFVNDLFATLLGTNSRQDLTGLRVLAVVAHPDDEAWMLGGLLAFLATRGALLHILCATNGEAWRPRRRQDPAPCPASVARRRREELFASADVLGVASVTTPELPDGRLLEHRHDLVHVVLKTVHALQPHLVLTHAPCGDYGHPDHVTVHRAVMEAVECGEQQGRNGRVERAQRVERAGLAAQERPAEWPGQTERQQLAGRHGRAERQGLAGELEQAARREQEKQGLQTPGPEEPPERRESWERNRAADARDGTGLVDREIACAVAWPVWPAGIFAGLGRRLTAAGFVLSARVDGPEGLPLGAARPGDGSALLSLPSGPHIESQEKAMACHASQLEGASPGDFPVRGLSRSWWPNARFAIHRLQPGRAVDSSGKASGERQASIEGMNDD